MEEDKADFFKKSKILMAKLSLHRDLLPAKKDPKKFSLEKVCLPHKRKNSCLSILSLKMKERKLQLVVKVA